MELMIGGTCLYWMDVYVWILLASKKEAIINYVNNTYILIILRYKKIIWLLTKRIE